ncbi:hypothetical protein VPH35_002440 [Triticum aestivum]
MAIAHSTEQSKEKLKQRRAAMVKILEIGGGPLDAEEDDDCCEIDPAEFAKKVNLKASADDDVVVVAAKGPIKVKVEVDRSEHSAETIPIIANGNGGLHGRIAGDRLDNPYEIEEDEPTIHQMEPLEAKPDVKSTPVEPLLVMSDSELPFGGLFADMSPVKREPEDGNVNGEPEDGTSGGDEHELSEEEVMPEMSLLKCDSECFEEVVNPGMSQAKCETEGNAGAVDEPIEEEIIPDMSPLKCGSECFEEVVIPDLSPVTHNSGTDELSKEKTIPAMPLLKSESEYFEDVAVPVMLPIKHKPEDHHGAEECVGEEDGYDHLPEMDKLSPEGRVFDEEDGDDVVVVAKQAL